MYVCMYVCMYVGLTSVSVESVPSSRHGGTTTVGGTFSQEGVVSSKWAKDDQITGTIKQVLSVHVKPSDCVM